MKLFPFKGRTIDPERRVRVYRNLGRGAAHKWSVQQGGLVVAHADDLTLAAARPVVSQAGRQRVLKLRQKQVHAFVEGYVGTAEMGVIIDRTPDLDRTRWFYNPYKADFFYDPHMGFEVKWADVVRITETGVWSASRHTTTGYRRAD